MAAEDYIDHGFEGDNLDFIMAEFHPSAYWLTHKARGPIVCKRCGTSDLHWQLAGGSWRLFTQDGLVHNCKSPVSRTVSSPVAPQPKESIMDKNAVAFIRNDVRSIEVVFIESERGRRTPLAQEEIVSMASVSKHYTYLTTDQTIEQNDWVIVLANGIPKAVFVVSVSAGLDIEPNAEFSYAYTIAKVDFSPYNRLNSQNRAISDMLRSSYKETLRQGFRATLLAGLPQDQQNQITLLLNEKGE